MNSLNASIKQNQNLNQVGIEDFRKLQSMCHAAEQRCAVKQEEINELRQSLKTAAQAAAVCEKQRQALEEELQRHKNTLRAIAPGPEQGIVQDQEHQKLLMCAGFAKQMKATVTVHIGGNKFTIDGTGE